VIVIAGVKLSNTTLVFGTPAMKLTVPLNQMGEPARELDREDVEQLRDACEAWLRGEVLR
jgi:hypothetical protein